MIGFISIVGFGILWFANNLNAQLLPSLSASSNLMKNKSSNSDSFSITCCSSLFDFRPLFEFPAILICLICSCRHFPNLHLRYLPSSCLCIFHLPYLYNIDCPTFCIFTLNYFPIISISTFWNGNSSWTTGMSIDFIVGNTNRINWI